MKTFFINLDRFDYQIEDTLDGLFKGFESLWAIDNKVLLNYNWQYEKEKIRRFPKKLLDTIEVAIINEDEQYRDDMFGNKYRRNTYQFIEVTSLGKDLFTSIRLLGEDDKGNATRFYVKNLKHNFEPTTLNFVINLREIIQPNCNAIRRLVDKQIVNTNYTWERLATEIFSPPAKVGPILDVSLFTKAFLKEVNDGMKKDSFNTDELNKRNRDIQSFINTLYSYNVDRTESSKSALSEISEENQQRAEEFRQTLDRIGNLTSRFNAKDLIADALQCLIPGSCEEFIRRLPVKHTVKMIKGMLPPDCPTYKEVEEAVDNVLIGKTKIYKKELEELTSLIEEQEQRYEEISGSIGTQSDIIFLNEQISSNNTEIENINRIFSEFYPEVENLVSDQNKRRELSEIKNDLRTRINGLSANDPLYVQKEQKIINDYKEWFSIYSEEVSGFAVFKQLEYNLALNRGKASQLETDIKDEIDFKLKDLDLTDRQIALFDREKLNMDEVYSNLEAFNQEELDSFSRTKNRIYDAVSEIVPLAGLCGVFGEMMDDIFDLFSKFPEPRELNDIFAGLSEEIILILLKLIAEIVLLVLETIINTLLNCSNIDAIVALVLGEASIGSLPGPESLGNAIGQGVSSLADSFVGELLEELSEIDAIASVLDVWGNAEPVFWTGYYEALKIDEKIRQIADNSNETRDFSLEGISVFDYQAVFKYLEVFSVWEVDPDGTGFIVSSENKTIKMQDFDRAMAISSEEVVNVIPAGVINEGLFTSITNNGKNNKETLEPFIGETKVFPSPQVMREELGDAIFSTTAIATPAEIINALAGEMSDETAQLAAEIFRNRAPNLSSLYNLNEPGNESNIKELFDNLGKVSGLDKLLPQLQIAAALPEVQQRLVANKLCEPYNNVDDFREALLKKIVPEKDAKEIIDNINNEKVNKYVELTDTLLNLSEGFAPDNITSNPAKKLLENINDKIFNPLKANENKPKNPNSEDPRSEDLKEFADSGKPISDFLRDKIQDRVENDQIYQGMMQTTIDSMINPIKDAFANAMEGLAEVDTEEVEKIKYIKRTKKFITKNETEFIGINPEFKDYINNGMVPIVRARDGDRDYKYRRDGKNYYFARMANKDSLKINKDNGEVDDFRVSGNKAKDYTTPYFSWSAFWAEVADNADFFNLTGAESPEGFNLGFESNERSKRRIQVKKKEREYGVSFKQGLSNIIEIQNGESKLKSYFGEAKDEGLILEFDKFESQNSEISKLIKNINVGKRSKGAIQDEPNIGMNSIASVSANNQVQSNSSNLSGIGLTGATNKPSLASNNNFSKNSKSSTMNLNLDISENFQNLTGLSVEGLKKEVPFWGLKLIEKGQTTSVKVDVEGSSISRRKGKVEFSEKYEKTYNKILVDEETKKSLEILFPDSQKTRKQAFYQLIKQNYASIDGESSNDRLAGSLEIQNKIFESMKKNITNLLLNSKIFKKTSFAVSGDEEEEKKYLYFIQLFNFAREPTEEEKNRGFDPNIMGFEGMNKRFMEIYNNEPEPKEEQEEEEEVSKNAISRANQIANRKSKKKRRKNGRTKRRTRFTNASYKMILEIILKLAVVEFCLKTLPVLESLKFSKSIIKNDFLKDFIKQKSKESIKTMGLWQIFIRETKNANPGKIFPRVFSENLETVFEQVLDDFARIFQICEKDRNIDSVRKELVDSLDIIDVHDRESNNESKFLKTKLVKGEVRKIPSQKAKELKKVISDKVGSLFKEQAGGLLGSFASMDIKRQAIEELSKIKKENTSFSSLSMENMFDEEKDPDKIEVEELYKKGDLVIERYVKFGKVNNPDIKSKFENRVMSLEKAKDNLSKILNNGKKLYDCENPNDGIFKDAPRFGLRLSYIADVSTSSSSKHKIKNSSFNTKTDKNNLFKLKETTGNKTMYFNIFELYSSELPIASNNLTIEDMIQGEAALLNLKNFNTYFYPILRKHLYSSDESRVLFDYCFGIKELIAVGMIHNYFLSNNEKMKFLLESVGAKIEQMFNVLDNFGDKTQTNATLNAMRAETKKNMENEGNPAGPLLEELLKIFIRTPIHILRGLATIVDPNIFLANLMVAGTSIAGALVGKKLWIPYILGSLAFFPAPLFVPPYMVPLSAYNIALPLGPIFLALEWLLWDLPWYKSAIAESEGALEILREYGIDQSAGPSLNDPDCEDDLEDEDLASSYDDFINGEPNTPFLDQLINKIKEECKE